MLYWRVKLCILEFCIRLLKLSGWLLLEPTLSLFIIALMSRKFDLWTFVPKFLTLKTIFIAVIHIELCLLCLLRCSIVYKKVRTIFSVGFCLLYPNSSHFTVLFKHIFNLLLGRKLRVDWKSNKQSATIRLCQIVIRQIANNLSWPFVVIRKLDF